MKSLKISTNLNIVSMILLHSAIIVWHLLCIGATVNCYLLYYRCKQENAICVTNFHCQFIQKCKFFIFDIIYSWKAQLLLYSNQKTHF